MTENANKLFLAALRNCLKEKYENNKTSYIQDAKTKGITINAGSLSSILNEKRRITPEMQEKLASACGYDLAEFLNLGKALIEGPKLFDKNTVADLEAMRCAVKSLAGMVDYLREENAALKTELAKLKMTVKELESAS
ncbi:MAG: hypothetical protein JRJ54_11425 [Deltaproteobacteria bacterium]|nr:hypothetical protein [Deltaproteobacteria bacterium]